MGCCVSIPGQDLRNVGHRAVGQMGANNIQEIDGNKQAQQEEMKEDSNCQEKWCGVCALSADILNKKEMSTTKSSRFGVSAKYFLHLQECHLPDKVKTYQLKDLFTIALTEKFRGPVVEALSPNMVGIATVFVSHAYSYSFHDVIEVILRYEEEHKSGKVEYYWFDPFSLNQHSDGAVVETEVLEKAFGEQVKSIGATLIVSSPWNNPAFLDRAWCLFEFMISINSNVPITILLPSSQEQQFFLDISSNWKTVFSAFSKINSRTAKAREKKDLDAINASIERTVSHANLNKLANVRMRQWLSETALRGEKTLDLDPNFSRRNLSNVRFDLAMMMRQLGFTEQSIRLNESCLLHRKSDLGETHLHTLRSLNLRGCLQRDLSKYEAARQTLEAVLGQLEAEHGQDHGDILDVLNNLALVKRKLGSLEEAEALYRRVLKGAEAEGLQENIAICLNNLARVLCDLGSLEEAEQLHRRSCELGEDALGGRHPLTFRSSTGLGECLLRMGKLEEADKVLQSALGNAEEILGPQSKDALEAMQTLAGLRLKQGRPQEAEDLARQLLKKVTESFGPASEEAARAHLVLGNALLALSQEKSAEECFRRVLQMVEEEETVKNTNPSAVQARVSLAEMLRVKGALPEAERQARLALACTNPESVKIMAMLAFIQILQGKFQEAGTLLTNALSHLKVRGKTASVEGFMICCHLAQVSSAANKPKEAEGHFVAAVSLSQQHPSVRHGLPANTYLAAVASLGVLLRRNGKLEQAEVQYRLLLQERKRLFGEEDQRTLTAMGNLAVILRERKQLREAEEIHRRAVYLCDKILGKAHPDTLNAQGNLGICLMQSENTDGSKLDEGRLLVKGCLESLVGMQNSFPNPSLKGLIQKFETALQESMK